MRLITLFINMFLLLLTSEGFVEIYNYFKCFSSLDTINLTNYSLVLTEFTLSMWIRLDEFTGDLNQKNFIIISTPSISTTITAQRNGSFFDLRYGVNLIGQVGFSISVNQDDILTKRQMYTTWKFLCISFRQSDLNLTLYMDNVFTTVLGSNLDLNSANLSLCSAGNLLNRIYFAHIIVSNAYNTLPANFNLLSYLPRKTLFVFTLLDSRNQNKKFYENLIDKSNKLKVMTSADPILTGEALTSPKLLFLKKFFEFDFKYFSLINNSYSVSTKVLLINPLNLSEEYILYSRISRSLDPLDISFVPDKLNFRLQVNNQSLVVECFVNQVSVALLSNTFYATTSFIFSLYIQNGIDFVISPNYSTTAYKIKIGINDSLTFSTQEAIVDLSHFESDDRHIFGYPQITLNYCNLFFIEYILNIGQSWTLTQTLFDPLLNDSKLSNFAKFTQKMNDTNIGTELALVTKANRNSTYCGLCNAKNCAFSPLGANANTSSFFSRFILNYNYYFASCYDHPSEPAFYYCNSASFLNHLVTYSGENVDANTTNFIQNNIISQMDLGNHFLIMIIVQITISSFSYKIVRHLLTSVEDFINVTFLVDYFNFLPNATFSYTIYFNGINPSNFVDLDTYPSCIDKIEKFKMNEILDRCVVSCPDGYFADDQNVCLKCPDKCRLCNSETCLECDSSLYLYNGSCFETSVTCIQLFENCTTCDVSNDFVCIGCIADYSFVQSLDRCEQNCYITDVNCQTCVVGEEHLCQTCVSNYGLTNGVCVFVPPPPDPPTPSSEACLDLPYSLSCFFSNPDKIESCQNNYEVDFINNLCLWKCEPNCLDCYLDNSRLICTQCTSDYKPYNGQCVDDFCFTEFCHFCDSHLFDLDCQKCFGCRNLLIFEKQFFECEKLIENCSLCEKDSDQNFNCVKCQDGYLINDSTCEQLNLNIFVNDFVYERNCEISEKLNSEKECKKLTYDCDIGCLLCYEENSVCYQCNPVLNFIAEINQCEKEVSILNLEEIAAINEIENLFQKRNEDCDEFYQKIILIQETNKTEYKTAEDFEVSKTTDFYELELKCNTEENDCMEINKNYKQVTLQNCEKKRKKYFEYRTKNVTNVTFFFETPFCDDKKIKKTCKETMECLNNDCLEYKIIKDCYIHNNIDVCLANYEGTSFLMNKITPPQIDLFTLCQKHDVFYNSAYPTCLQRCIINLEKSKKYFTFSNLLPNSQVIFDLDTFHQTLPQILKVTSSDGGKVIEVEYNFQFKKYEIILKPKHIKSAYNCRLRHEIKFIFINDDFIESSSMQTINRVITTVLTSNFLLINVFSPNLIPDNIFEILQFNEFFTFLYYLNISGGSFYNYFVPYYTELTDQDVVIAPKDHLYYDFQNSRKRFSKLTKQSVLDFFLLTNILIIFVIKLILTFCYKKRRRNKKTSNNNQKKNIKESPPKNFFSKIYAKLKSFFHKVNYKKLYANYISSVWNLYIINLPHYILLFINKFNNLQTSFKVFYFIYFIIVKIFFFSKIFSDFHVIYKFYYLKKIKKLSNLKRVIFEQEIFIYHYRVIFILFSLFKIFLIDFYFNKTVTLIMILVFDFISCVFYFFFSQKSIRMIFFIKLIPILFFIVWLILVILDEFYLLGLDISLNVFYVLSNFFKLFEVIFLIFKLKSLKKELKKNLENNK